MLTSHHLSSLFEPDSVAVVGASEQPHSAGRVIFKNLLDAGFHGHLYAVNPKHETVLGQTCHHALEDIGRPVDTAVIAAPARTLNAIIQQCGRSGVRNAVIVTSVGEGGGQLERRILETARHAGVRLLGPGSLGIVRPDRGLNAALTKIAVGGGDLALVSQSGAMCSVVLDWAEANHVGFSAVVSLSSTIDVDFGEVLDYLAHDDRTRYILLYVDHIRNARHFMSALRSAARVKPLILLKAGRHDRGSEVAGSASLSDVVFDAAMRRAGVVRVQNIGQLFFAAKALASGFRPRVDRVAIVTNGGGPGTMAADRALDLGTPLVELSAETVAALDRLSGATRRCSNPLDLGGEADAERYREAIRILAKDPAVDNLLVILSPHAMTDPVDVARAVIELAAETRGLTLCCCWMGGGQVAEARKLLEQAEVPVFRTPETAVELLHNISGFYRGQALLLQTAGQTGSAGQAGSGGARMLVETLLGQRRSALSAMESKALLRSFGMPVTQTMVARDATEAMFVAEQVGFPVVMKIDSPDLVHKAAAGGIRLNLVGTEAVWNAFHDIVGTVRARYPEAQINGVSIESYLHRPNGRELRIRVFRDAVFGPVISLGAGGLTSDHFSNQAFALPPLNKVLARDLIDSAPVARLLDRYHDLPAADRGALEAAIVSVSDLASELPWVRELEVDPLIVDEAGAIVVDARVVIDQGPPAGGDRYAHMAIHPYPANLIHEFKLADGRRVRIRPVRPEDAAPVQAFFDGLSREARYYRFMEEIDELSPTMVARFTQIDYDREMALLAIIAEGGIDKVIGSARYALAPDGESVEFALAVADEWQRYGIGRRLMGALIDCARGKGWRSMEGDVLASNAKMLRMMQALAFKILPHPEQSTLKHVVKRLRG